MSVSTLPKWIRPAITVAYSISGWIIVEIPVVLGVLPSTFDGFSTAALAGGLAFVLSAASFVHNELKPYLISPNTEASAAASPEASPAAGAAESAKPEAQASSQPGTGLAVPQSSIPSNYGTLLSGVQYVTASDVGKIALANGGSVLDSPIGSAVQKTSAGWYVVTTPKGAVVYTKVNPFA